MDQLTKDLARKAGEDAAGAITRTMALMDAIAIAAKSREAAHG